LCQKIWDSGDKAVCMSSRVFQEKCLLNIREICLISLRFVVSCLLVKIPRTTTGTITVVRQVEIPYRGLEIRCYSVEDDCHPLIRLVTSLVSEWP